MKRSFQPVHALLLVMLAAWLIHLGMVVGVPSPYIFPDELIYLDLSRHLAHGDGLLFRGEPLSFPTVLYPILLVPAQLVRGPVVAYRLAQLITSAFMVLAACPVFLLARLLMPPAWALAAAALTLVAPFVLYGHTIMTEGLFMLLLMAVAYATVQAIVEPTVRWKWALGALLGLAFFARPQGMLLAPVVLATFLISEAWRRGESPGFWVRMARFWPAVVLFFSFVSLHGLRVAVSSPGANLASPATYLGTYAGGLTGKVPFTWAHFGTAAASILGALALGCGFWPLALCAVNVARSAWREALPVRVFYAFTLLVGAMLVGLAAQNVAILNPLQTQERYCIYVIPLAIVGALHALSRSRASWVAPGVLAAALVGLSACFMQRSFHTLVDTPSYMALYRPSLTLGWPGTAVAAAVAGLVYMAVLAWSWRQGRRRLALALALAYGLAVTGLSYYAQATLSGIYALRRPLVAWVQATAGPDHPIALVSDGLPYITAGLIDAFARQPLRQYYLEAPFADWLEQPATRRPDGEVPELSALPDGTRVVASASLPFALPVLGRRDDVVVYEKYGPVRLRRSD